MHSTANDSYYDEDAPLFQDEQIQAITPVVTVAPDPSPSSLPRRDGPKWDLLALGVAPKGIPEDLENPLAEPSVVRLAMPDPAVDPPSDESAVNIGASQHSRLERPPPSIQSQPDHAVLQETAALAVQKSQSNKRVDSKHNSEDAVPQLSPEKRKELKVETRPRSTSNATFAAEDSLTNSPTLHKHMIHIDQSPANLPAVQPNSPPQDRSATSTRNTSVTLPPMSELAHLANLAEQQAQQAQQDSRIQPSSHQHKPSFSSTTTSQSPRLPIHSSYASSAQTSPVSYAAHSATARSPASTIGDGSYYGAPYAQYAGAQPVYFADRRPSTATDGQQVLTPNVPSLRSGSSSESHGHAGSSTDGISTAQTTPIDSSALVDGTPRPILPPPAGMNNIGIFKCDFDGCSAQPFQTQYLLSSHKNVHSSSRPHYCPVPECPRSEGGKGFKRKNEMIRHGLVHNSPGYVCPFCPDRDHRYPRPDNLQRHVRVHHVDKDKDDPLLREVLGQRPEGAIQKQRRRRTQSTAAPELSSAS